MEKLKKARVKVHVCPTCKGNGYVKVASLEKDESTAVSYTHLTLPTILRV